MDVLRRRWCLRRGPGLLVALTIPALCPAGAGAQGDVRIGEYRIKAAFLFKFLPFIDWPAHAFDRSDAPLVIGVFGADALADELDAIVPNRLVNERRVQVRRLRRNEVHADLHVLFVGRPQYAALPQFVAAHKGRPLLTVTEHEEAGSAAGIINFVVVDDRVRFDVALKAAELAQIGISSRLLALARRVLPAANS